MGGGCAICGYNKCDSSLACHHIDPSQKDIGLGKIRANAKNWKSITEELKKCVLLCHNCHTEVHEGITQIPDNYTRFQDLSFESLKSSDQTQCPICGNSKPIHLTTCSRKCSAQHSKINWDLVDLPKELETKSYQQIAQELGCSDCAVYKRAKKLGLR